ncbi:16S rRNA (guanine(527)-N(7))-methyltransferase RsmG [Angustibacter peucedani]
MTHDDHDGGAPPAATELPPVPSAAEAVFAEQLPLAERYVEHLASTGVAHGLIGPREVPRLWERHVLNCAVLSDLLPQGARVADIGSGAGLPGLCLAVRRPDLHVVLVEPLLRRVTWLEQVVADLGLDQRVAIHRGRAQEVVGRVSVPFVTARAVASLDKLAAWGFPLLEPGGALVAIKGRSAGEELAGLAGWLDQAGVTGEVVEVGGTLLAEPTVVVRLDRGTGPLPRPAAAPTPGRRARRARRSA